MRLRDLFRGQSNHERKLTSSILPALDTNTFINAAQDKDIDTLQRYLIAGFPPDQPDPITKTTALHVAVESGNFRAVQLLIQAGAHVNVCDSSLATPLHIAAYFGYEEIVQILLSHSADVFKQDNTGRNPFHLAVSTGNHRSIQHFLSNIDPEQNIIHIPDAQNWTPLMCACASNHPSICALLLTHGADLCAINDRGQNALHIGAFLGSLPVIHELLNTSFDDEIVPKGLNQGDNRNQTPLFYACIEGHLDVALHFLQSGANAYHLDDDNQTCLHAMLSSSIILKRHIRLFYRFITYVDYRLYQDHLSRTLLDLAYLNQLNTLIYLLTILNYKRNYAILSSIDNHENNFPIKIPSLHHLCIILFKRSIIYHQNQKQLSQHDLLENALQQCFQINLHEDIGLIEKASRKSLDDLIIPNKKSSKTSWSIFTNKFKHQRTSTIPSQESTNLSISLPQSSSVLTNYSHPMKNLAIGILISPNKIDDLLDFPSLNNNHLLYDDMQTTMNTYNLNGNDSSNQI